MASKKDKVSLFDEGTRITRSMRKIMDMEKMNGTRRSKPNLEAESSAVVMKASVVTEPIQKIKISKRTAVAINLLHEETIQSLTLHERSLLGPGTQYETALSTTDHIGFDPPNQLDKNFLVTKTFVDRLLLEKSSLPHPTSQGVDT